MIKKVNETYAYMLYMTGRMLNAARDLEFHVLPHVVGPSDYFVAEAIPAVEMADTPELCLSWWLQRSHAPTWFGRGMQPLQVGDLMWHRGFGYIILPRRYGNMLLPRWPNFKALRINFDIQGIL